MTRKIAFVLPPLVELLDLAGPTQVFREASLMGIDIDITFYAVDHQAASAVGLPFGKIMNYRKAVLGEGDFIFIPGFYFEGLKRRPDIETSFFRWLSDCSTRKINICSVCNAAFILGSAGLLDDRECTTHWRSTALLQSMFPAARVLTDVLFVKSGNIYTSAGISSGIDMALSILEEWLGPLVANQVARALVIYHRRSGKHSQQHIYLDYRNHLNPRIHQLQDYMINHLEESLTVDTLAELFNSSSRNLTRIFKEATGITINEYLTRLRVEKAGTLRNNPAYTITKIASECGFRSARQLQRILKKYGESEK
ncbi:GlxA family transcriptional regulator [Chitinophaga varians]|uniref:GlxA family transcriptional regulator n=1 Tax=Chitinophaga varians TaxID=2202339 RepID=UPI00165F9CDF|nr:AraC family transcriptional regulator [Chitinophaga varians]MBC9914568.1 AraC family transcriptional regulator [Chitinophaga varians]